MSPTSPYFKIFNLFFVAIFLISFNFAVSDDLCLEGICKTILMKEKIIYINDAYDDISINYYDFTTQSSNLLRNYATTNIVEFKNILKISESEFIIYGLNLDSNPHIFYYDIYSITETSGNLNINIILSGNRNLGITSLDFFDAKILSGSKKLIAYGSINSHFQVYLINLESTTSNDYLSYQFPRDTEIDSRLTSANYRKENIQCNSLDGNNFFCTFFYSNKRTSTGDYTTFYLNGNFMTAWA